MVQKGILFTLNVDNHVNGLDLAPIRNLWQLRQYQIIIWNINKLVV